ncbi:epidermal surface antigen [Planococcus antarcticus DSM 14505]|uniref:Epidermal surface antigen n=1 Tax=Planococcus antarcticus DSM 14505 TaxID=1185653 RepID=A0A1C7DKP7_9BACL|nr:flotillin family protein [Planococcus antarcticus]ANU11997.1 flotillin [Planococcus antarcticus DSM 14505]EIM07979.1 epidermal surface antigen [Planococcus antarcticus DSM 14505]
MQSIGIITVIIALVIIAAIVGIGYFFWMKIRYRTAKSNEALIITGPKLGDPSKDTNIFNDDEGRSMKIIRGGGYLLRRFQTSTPVSLTSFQLKLATPRVYTNAGVPIVADAVAMVKVADTLNGIANYAEQFLGKEQEEIETEIIEVLGSNLRAILSKMTVEDINSDREKFNTDVQEVAQKQLDLMGFKITSLGLTDLRDADENNGYLENLGRPRIAEVRKLAEIAEANTERETRIHRAQTDQEAKEEEYLRQISTAQSKKEKDIKDAAFKEETERARAKSEQSYELEKAKLAMEIQEEELNMQFVARERAVRLEEEESKVRKTKADATYYETTRSAEGDARRAVIDGEAKAKIKRDEGAAEAEVIRERGKAEAESRKLLAEAMEEHGDVIITEKLIDMLPVFAEKVAMPLSNIESVKIIDSGNGQGIPSFGRSVTKTMVDMQEPLKEMTGIDIGELLKSYVNRNTKPAEQAPVAAFPVVHKEEDSHSEEDSSETEEDR